MRVIVSGGGTGGHINPAIAIAKYIKEVEPESEILYVGTEHGLEKKLVPAQNIDITYIDVYGFKRKLSLSNLYVAFKAVKGIFDSKKILREFKPDVVIGTGGYVCGPLLQAAVKHSTLTPRSTRVRASAIAEHHPLVKAAVAAGRECFISPTTSDRALMSAFPALKIGVGESCRSHTADEFVKISEIEQGISIYCSILKGLANEIME